MDATDTIQTISARLLDPQISEQTKLNVELGYYLLDGIRDYAIFMIKPDGNIGTWNPGVERLLGYKEDEFVGAPFSMIFTESDISAGSPHTELSTAYEKGRAEDQRWHRKKDGSVFWANGLVTLMKDDNGDFKGYAKIMRDQTAHKRFEEEIERKNVSLEIANNELKNFASVVSHDLNSPLQTMQGFANLLKGKQGLDEEVETSIGYILESTQRMSTMVNELLKDTLSAEKIDRSQTVNTNTLMDEIVRGLSEAIESSNAMINYNNLPEVWTDPILLGRVFQNLIENSIKYSKVGISPEIAISAKVQDGEVTFVLNDNGRGIPHSKVKQLFTMFERLDPSEGIQGHGIGLATCRKIIERFGGKIWAESEVDKGTTFYFRIPSHSEKTATNSKASSYFVK